MPNNRNEDQVSRTSKRLVEINPAAFDLVSLKLFISVIEEGNMARAAERQHITASAISRRITNLEQRIGMRLLVRTERGVKPTQQGIVLLDCAREVFATIEGTARHFDAEKAGVAGSVRVLVHMSAVSSHLMRAISQFHAFRPDIKILIEERVSSDILSAICSAEADIGFISGTVASTGLNSVAWRVDELIAIAPLGHSIADQKAVKFDTLLQFPFIAMQRDSALCTLFEQAALTISQSFLPRAYMASFQSVLLMVEEGLGISIVPRAQINEQQRLFEVIPLDEKWAKRQLNLCFREAGLLPASQLFIDHLTKVGKTES